MNLFQILTLTLLSVFYVSYITKMFMLKRRGIKGYLLSKGDKPNRARKIEFILRIVTPAGAVIQFGSVIFSDTLWQMSHFLPICILGILCLIVAVLIFFSAVITMKNNWRAGFERNQNTNLVTHGIYRFSRNPAFVSFDLLYTGSALIFPNAGTIMVAVIAIILFHIQILGEENYLIETFGQEYVHYKLTVRRYI